MTTVRKIIVDSRYFFEGTAGAGTFELSEIVDIHPSQVLYLESYQSVNSWYTIDETNQNIYVVENPSGGTYNARTTQSFHYTLIRLGSVFTSLVRDYGAN